MWFESFYFKVITLNGIPNLSTKNLGLFILNNSTCPGRYAFTTATFPFNQQLIQLCVSHCIIRKADFPHTILHLLQLIIRVSLPVIKISNQKNGCCIRSPFSKHPSIGQSVQAKIQITGSKVGKTGKIPLQFLFNFQKIFITTINCICIRCKIWIGFYNRQNIHTHSFSTDLILKIFRSLIPLVLSGFFLSFIVVILSWV